MLTDAKIRGARAKDTAIEIADPSSRGLRLRVTPQGKKSFVYRYSHPTTKKMTRITLGLFPNTSLSAARDKWEEMKQLRDKGTDPKMHLVLEKAREQEE